MKTTLGFLCTFFVLVSTIQAQGRTGTIENDQWGVAFTIPEGWVGQQGPEGYLIGSHTERGVILLLQHNYGSLDALRTEAQKGLNDGYATQLMVDGPVQSFGDRGLAAALQGRVEGQSAQGYVVSVLSPHGGGVTILTAVTPTHYTSAYAQRVKQIAESVQFAEPNAAPADAAWATWFKGSRLTAMSSYYSSDATGGYVGGSEKTVVDLCSAGHFFYEGSSSFAVDGGMGGGYNAGGYGGDSSQGSGQWSVIQQGGQPTLQLTFQSGSVSAYTISYPDEELYLNGKRFYWTTHNSPADYRPQCP